MLPSLENEVARPVPETMTMTERVLHDVVVLEINGRMTIEAQQSELSGLVKQRIAAGYHAFLFNLGGVPYCDTRGLAELIVSLTIVEGARVSET